jgi:hypothetical protein
MNSRVEGKLSFPRSPTNQINNPRNKTILTTIIKIVQIIITLLVGRSQ